MPLNPATLANGSEQHEIYSHPAKKGKTICQYDFRCVKGHLFSCVAPSLLEAKSQCHLWFLNNLECARCETLSCHLLA